MEVAMSLRMPDDFEWNGWCRNNNYLLKREDFPDNTSYSQERFRRSTSVYRAFSKTPEAKAALSIEKRKEWEARVAEAHRTSNTTEVLLLEALTKREDGITTSEMVAGCINIIARELSKRGVAQVEDLGLKDLVLISNSLIGLMKAAAATKKEQDWKPQVQVNNVTVNNTSKTGGVVGGLRDVIDVESSE
jgi:hypothetical protein